MIGGQTLSYAPPAMSSQGMASPYPSVLSLRAPVCTQVTQLAVPPLGSGGMNGYRAAASYVPKSPVVSARSIVGVPGVASSSASSGGGLPRKVGDVVTLGGREFEVLGELGRGSFGVVWEAQENQKAVAAEKASNAADKASSSEPFRDEEENEPVALKVSNPASGSAFEVALFEATVLRELAAASREATKAVPRYIAHEVSGPSGGKRSVSIAMTKLSGGPVDTWLYGPGVNELKMKTMSISKLVNGPLPGGQAHTRDLEGAASIAAGFLGQVAPVFEALEGIAFHRDVSAHNFLVDASGDGLPQFALIDFGLAVRANTWRQEYKSTNLAGTPHYFAPATWMLFTYGHKYLENHPNQGYLRQYQERLDHFAIGALAMELFFMLWDGSGDATRELKEARTAWKRYWSQAFWFYQGFFQRGCQNFRTELQGCQAVSKLATLQTALCAALRAASGGGSAATLASAGGSTATVAPALSGLAARVLSAGAELLDPSATTNWAQLPAQLGCCGKRSRAPTAITDFESGSTQTEPPALPQRKRTFSHRRVWTVDEAVGLRRNVADAAVVSRGEARQRLTKFEEEVPGAGDEDTDDEPRRPMAGTRTERVRSRGRSRSQETLTRLVEGRAASPPSPRRRAADPVLGAVGEATEVRVEFATSTPTTSVPSPAVSPPVTPPQAYLRPIGEATSPVPSSSPQPGSRGIRVSAPWLTATCVSSGFVCGANGALTRSRQHRASVPNIFVTK
eukprot:TRINITY_DN5044_c0_g1_i2.p1 TRINITY_DN5044_c0_g1~~TRINITY_DN5044_c0_g1_i2.p1  ORF type:complete len:758 (+),score=139.74 TRINITY_DN5044_c0_g1_i2:62-2275(+)